MTNQSAQKQFTYARAVAIRILKALDPVFMELHTLRRAERLMKQKNSPFDYHRLKQTRQRIEAVRQEIDANKIRLGVIGDHLLHLARHIDENESMSIQAKAQLLGAPVKAVIAAGDDTVVHLAFAHAVEYRGDEDFLPLNDVSMPVYSAMRERMLSAMLENDDFRQATDELLYSWIDEAQAAKRPRLVYSKEG